MSDNPCGNLPEILLVEDSPTDVLMTREALAFNKVLNPLHCVEDGVAAMQYLRREGPYANARRPSVIILDLNLPKKSGREVLEEIKNDEDFKKIPVVILTTSQSEEDVAKSYGLHANCYIPKPVNFERFVEVVRSINEFWFCVAVLPPDKR